MVHLLKPDVRDSSTLQIFAAMRAALNSFDLSFLNKRISEGVINSSLPNVQHKLQMIKYLATLLNLLAQEQYMQNRITFSTATPNNQGGVIPNNVIDFSRFNKNPVVLKNHKWDDDPMGFWSDIKQDAQGNWSGVPVFHGLTDESKLNKSLYEGGWIRGASIGGETVWEKNNAGQPKLDKDGNRICKVFYLYEISIVTLPSNEDAVSEETVKLNATHYEEELQVKIYEANEIEKLQSSITTLSSKFNPKNNMETNNTQDETPVAEATKTEAEKTALAANDSGTITLKTSELPGFLEKIVKSVKTGLESIKGNPSKNIKDLPTSEMAEENLGTDANAGQKIKLKAENDAAAEKAKAKLDKTKDAAEKATKKVKETKEKADKEDATDEDMAAHKEAKKDAEEAMKACESAEKEHDKVSKKTDAGKDEDNDDDEEDEEAAKKTATKKNSAEKTTNSAMKPIMKTTTELREELTLAAAPEHRIKVKGYGGKSFTQLAASTDNNDKRLLERVLCGDKSINKDIAEYSAVAESMLVDTKISAITEKVRLMMNVSENQLPSYRSNPNSRAGISLQTLAAQLNRGEIDILGTDNVLRQKTTLSSSDAALASPALNAIEFLSLAIFRLFPSSSWKNEISMLPAEITGKNTGVIWANIAADPTIYKGNQPVSPADYTYSDTPVSLALVPYWMNPIRWTPLTMHQLRYDQMGTGWAQAFNKMNTFIDDNLIYQLASTVPASSIFSTTGLSGNAVVPATFNISGPTNPNAFYYNPAFVGSLLNPVLNDVISIEQLYNKQNFELQNERATLLTDPTMDALFAKDPETKSLLTRWINQEGGSMEKFKNTLLPRRSRVAIYDPFTGQVKDPNGAIPSTAVSAALGFIPSQVAIAIAMLDVFMIQDPSNYGYKMSADTRMGIAPLRADFSGTSLLTYGTPNV